jgi:hypothetical protein
VTSPNARPNNLSEAEGHPPGHRKHIVGSTSQGRSRQLYGGLRETRVAEWRTTATEGVTDMKNEFVLLISALVMSVCGAAVVQARGAGAQAGNPRRRWG